MRHIFRLAATAALAVGFAGTALAADMPRKAPAEIVAQGWTGFYVGAHVGGASSHVDPTFSDPGRAGVFNCGPCFFNSFATQEIDQSDKALVGGIHLGYNWQVLPNWVIGIEGDFTWSRLSHTTDAPLGGFTIAGAPFNVPSTNLHFQTDINWLASMRARTGYVFDNWLIYGTGGLAWANIDFSGTATCFPTGATCGSLIQTSASLSTTRTGWVIGGGVEWQAPVSYWRVRAEYLYYAFDGTETTSALWMRQSFGVPASCFGGVAVTCSGVFSVGDISIQTFRVGLTYALQ